MFANPILLVEDNPDDEALTLRALEEKQHSPTKLWWRMTAWKRLDYLLGTGSKRSARPPRDAAGRSAGC